MIPRHYNEVGEWACGLWSESPMVWCAERTADCGWLVMRHHRHSHHITSGRKAATRAPAVQLDIAILGLAQVVSDFPYNLFVLGQFV